MPSAKQQPSNIKHDVGIRPNVCKLTFGPPCTILDSRFPPENAISEGRPPLCNSSSETGSLPQEVRIENDSDRKFLSPKFKKYFLETTFLYVSCYHYHYEPKMFFRFFLEISFSDRKFSKSKYFKSFSGNYSCSCFMLP